LEYDALKLVEQRVHEYYWQYDWNCASTTLRILAEDFGVELHEQVLDAALGMHGAGGYRAQCGLVEGALMFIGVIGKARGLSNEAVEQACYAFAQQFENRFGSLLCRELRPQGFHPDNPPHLCEGLTRDAIEFDIVYITDLIKEKIGLA
jgi:C_GCAxxG_C_C family probable redox protein